MRIYLSVIASLIVLIVLSCKHDPINGPIVDDPVVPTDPTDTVPTGPGSGVTCDPDTVYFQNTILPLLVANCTQSGCHNANDHQDGVVLTSYDNLMNTVDKVRRTDWDNNDLIEVLTEDDPDKRMPRPPNQPLSTAQINQIKTWISQGAKNNGCNENAAGCETTGVTYANFFQPLVQAKCQGCHNAATASGGVVLVTYDGARTVALNGKLYAAVTRTTNWMPNGGAKLDACTQAKIKAWVDAGAPQN